MTATVAPIQRSPPQLSGARPLLGAPGKVYSEGAVFALVSLNVCVAGVCIYVLGGRIWRLGRSAYRRLVAAEPETACRLLEGILREYAGAVRQAVAAQEPTGPERGAVDPVQSCD